MVEPHALISPRCAIAQHLHVRARLFTRNGQEGQVCQGLARFGYLVSGIAIDVCT